MSTARHVAASRWTQERKHTHVIRATTHRSKPLGLVETEQNVLVGTILKTDVDVRPGASTYHASGQAFNLEADFSSLGAARVGLETLATPLMPHGSN